MASLRLASFKTNGRISYGAVTDGGIIDLGRKLQKYPTLLDVFRGGAIADVYTMKLDGSEERRLTDFKAMSWAPYFHPSGRYVIFTSNKLGFSNFELYLVDAAGDFAPCIRQHLAMFAGDDRGKLFGVRVQQFLELEHHARTTQRRRGGPGRRTAARHLQGADRRRPQPPQ